MEVSIKGDNVALTFTLDTGHPSSTGKSTIRYTTGGYVAVGGNLLASVNVIEGKIKAAPQDKVNIAK